jgi:hypothetical protein
LKDCLNLTIGKSPPRILQKSSIKYYYCFGIRMLRLGSEHEFTVKNDYYMLAFLVFDAEV